MTWGKKPGNRQREGKLCQVLLLSVVVLLTYHWIVRHCVIVQDAFLILLQLWLTGRNASLTAFLMSETICWRLCFRVMAMLQASGLPAPRADNCQFRLPGSKFVVQPDVLHIYAPGVSLLGKANQNEFSAVVRGETISSHWFWFDSAHVIKRFSNERSGRRVSASQNGTYGFFRFVCFFPCPLKSARKKL